MAMDLTKAAAILKDTYADGVTQIDYQSNPTLTLMKKRKGSLVSTPFGNQFVVPILHGTPQTENASFSQGQTNAGNYASKYSRFLVTPATNYGFARVDGDVVRRATGEGAFVDAMSKEIDNASFTVTRALSIAMFRTGYGERAQISATSALNTTVTLADKSQVRFIEKDMELIAAAAISSGAYRSGTSIKVTGRNVSAGTITLAANASTQSWAVSDYLFQLGDRANSPAVTKIRGFAAWVPSTAPSGGESFFGLDRSVDDRLGGLRLDATTSGTIEEALLDGMALVGSEGGKTTHIVMGPNTYNKLVKTMNTKVFVDITTEHPDIGFRGVSLTGGSGTADVFADPNCPEGDAYLINSDDWEIMYAGDDLVYVEESDGLMFRRVANADQWQTDIVTCCALVCQAPGHQGHVYNL